MEQTNPIRSTVSVMESPVQTTSLMANYQPEFDMDFVKRLLGRQKTDSLTRSTRNRLQKMHEGVHQLLHPRVVWGVFPVVAIEKGQIEFASGLTLKSHKMARAMTGAEQLVCFVATIGSKIDLKINQLMDQGKIANAYTCDALGSGAVESVAERFQSGFDRKFSSNEVHTAAGIRFSPGYCDWQVTEQHKLFSLVDAGAIGVTLDKSSLMTPRKSISAIFGLYPKGSGPATKKHNPCFYCFKKDCLARRSPAETIN